MFQHLHLRFYEARSFRRGGEIKAVDLLLMDARAEDGVNPEDSELPPFIAEMEGKTYTFQVRGTTYNFTEHHKTFTICIVDEINREPLPDVDSNGDDGDDKPSGKPLPVEAQSVGVNGNARKKTAGSASKVSKKARVA